MVKGITRNAYPRSNHLKCRTDIFIFLSQNENKVLQEVNMRIIIIITITIILEGII
jgi:hypothetical protein